MSNPMNASPEGQGRKYVWPPTGEVFPSVTTILSVLNKPALVDWAARQAAIYAVREQQRLSKMNSALAVSEIATTHKRISELSSEIGTHVHECIESSILQDMVEHNPWPEQMRHFDKWKEVYKPKFLMTEVTVYNRTVCYAGTLDILANIDGVTTLIDIKTGKNLYPEMALQLAAYANGEWYDAKGAEAPLPKIEAAAVLHLRMTGWRFVPVEIGPEVFTAFRHINEAWRWQAYGSTNVLGEKGLLQ